MTNKTSIQIDADTSGINRALKDLGGKTKDIEKSLEGGVLKVDPREALKHLDSVSKAMKKLRSEITEKMALGVDASGADKAIQETSDKLDAVRNAAGAANTATTNQPGSNSPSARLREAASEARKTGDTIRREIQRGIGGAALGHAAGSILTGNVSSAIPSAAGAAGMGLGSILGKIPGIGWAATGIGTAAALFGAGVAGKMGAAEQEFIAVTDLRRKMGAVGNDFDTLRAAVRASANAMSISYNETIKLTDAFAKTTGVRNGMDASGSVAQSGTFARGFGLDPGVGVNFSASMRQFTGERDQKRLALLIGDAVANGKVFTKADEVMQALSHYTSEQTRAGIGGANYRGYAGGLSNLTGGPFANDVIGAASLLSRLDAGYKSGGDEAMQNFRLGSRQRYYGRDFSGLDSKLLDEQGIFGTGKIFQDMLKGPLAGWIDSDTKKRWGGYGKGGKTGIDLSIDAVRAEHGDNFGLMVKSLAAHGVSESEAIKLLGVYKQHGSVGAFHGKLSGMGFDPEKIKMSAIGTMSELSVADRSKLLDQAGRLRRGEGYEKLSGKEEKELAKAEASGKLEDLRKAVLSMTGSREVAKDEGDRTRDSLAKIDNRLQDFAGKLIPSVNLVREAVLFIGSKKASDFREDMLNAYKNAPQVRGRVAAINADLRKDTLAASAIQDPVKRRNQIAVAQERHRLGIAEIEEEFSAQYENRAPATAGKKWTKDDVRARIDATARAKGSSIGLTGKALDSFVARSMAVAEKESGFNPYAEGKTIDSRLSAHVGDRGIGVFQFMAKTAASRGIDRHDPAQNIDAGIDLLANAYKKHGVEGMHKGIFGEGASGDGQSTQSEYLESVKKKERKFKPGDFPSPTFKPFDKHSDYGDKLPAGASGASADRVSFAPLQISGMFTLADLMGAQVAAPISTEHVRHIQFANPRMI